MYTGLSNGGHIDDSRMVVRSVSVHSPANAASRARTDLRIQALPRLYRITPMPCINIDFGAKPYFFYYSLCINYLLWNDFFNYHYYYYLRFALFFVHRKMIRGLRRHSAGLHWACYVTTSSCRALRSATSGPAWGMEPCPASSSDRVINTEHISQLSRFHAQSFNFKFVFGSTKHYTFLEKSCL